MATIDLGKVKLVWRGTYSGSFNYVPDDVVEYADGSVTSSYICVTATTGNAPSSGGSVHSSWNYMAKGQSTSPTTTQGDLIVRGASADQRLAIGSAGEVLKVNSSANGLEYGVAGKLVNVTQSTYSTREGLNATNSRRNVWNVSFTKQKTNTLLRVHLIMPLGGSGDTYPHFGTNYIRFSTGNYGSNGSDIFGYIHNTRATSNNMGAILTANFLYDSTGTNISGTGTIYVSIGYDCVGSGTVRPSIIWNPNSNEDNRARQSISNIVIEELQ